MSYDDDNPLGYLATMIVCLGFGIMIGFLIRGQTPHGKYVCDYLHGTWHKDVCVKDGRTVPTK